MTTTNMLGPSHRTKENQKGYFQLTYDTITPGSGIAMEVVETITSDKFQSDPNCVPWSSKPVKECVISTNGYTGNVTISGSPSKTFHIYEGIIVNVT
jgi:hypothetical protein